MLIRVDVQFNVFVSWFNTLTYVKMYSLQLSPNAKAITSPKCFLALTIFSAISPLKRLLDDVLECLRIVDEPLLEQAQAGRAG